MSRHNHKIVKPVVRHTLKERAHLRAVKRRSGGAAVRRRERRHEVLEILECGCKKTRVRMETCPQHTRCDGNHGGPRCADPNCWNDEAVEQES